MDSSLIIKPVDSNKDKRAFIRFPWKIYRSGTGNPQWVPPLLLDEKDTHNEKTNPFYKHAEIQRFMAFRGREAVGRIAAVIDWGFVEYQKTKTGFFGFLETEDNNETAEALFHAAEEWLKQRGMERIIGPMNPSSNHILGFLVDGSDRPPMIMMPYNPGYYLKLASLNGYEKDRDLFAYRVDHTIPLSEKMKRVSAFILEDSDVEIRSINIKNLKEEARWIREIYNDAWRDNWGFVPWTLEEIDHMADVLKLICIPDLVLLCFLKGEAIGFSIALPNLNQIFAEMNGRLLPFGFLKLLGMKKKVSQLRVAVLGIKRKYQGLGLDAPLYVETYRRSVEHGIDEGEFSWILEDNSHIRTILDSWGAEHHKTYRIMGKDLL